MNYVPKIEGERTMQLLANAFVEKALSRDMTIGVLGLGYVGIPLMQALIKQGFRVQGFDINSQRTDLLASGRSPFKHISHDSIRAMVRDGRFEGINDFSRLSEPDAILICVPTPLNRYKEPDLSFVIRSTESIAKVLRPGQLVALESTTWPGTCDEVVTPILEQSGLKAGVDFAVVYSPEREDPGNVDFEASTIPKIVGANSEPEQRMAVSIYETFTKVVSVKDCRTAEAIKVTENIFRWVNIGLVNELKTIFDPMEIDVWDVIDGAATKPFGFMPFYPGPGVGGHCIPLDPYYLSWKAKEFNVSARFIELAGEVNDAMPQYVVSRLTEAMNDNLQKALSGSRILLVGMAYKADIDDPRESPSLPLIGSLLKRGAIVDYYDPAIPQIVDLHEYPALEGMKSIEWTVENLSSYDAAVIATSHKGVDYAALCDALPLVVDSRNATKHVYARFHHKIVKA